MLPHKHFVYGILLSLILALVLPDIVGFLGVLLILSATVLIDFDHYLYYVYTRKDYYLINAYRFFVENRKKFRALSESKRAEYYGAWCMFHGLEALTIALILTFLVSEYFGFVFIGMAFHLIIDYVEQWRLYSRKDRISSAYDFLKFRKLRNINDK